VAADNFLFCTARTNDTPYVESLLCFDGVGWHKLTDLVTNGTDAVNMLAYDSVNNYLWYHSGQKAQYIQMGTSSFPYANFPTTGTNRVFTSRMDMGFRRIVKSMSSLFVEARNLTSDRYIDVYYSLDGNNFKLWERIIESGITELKYPGGNLTEEFNYIILRFDFVTDDSAQSPILESYTINFIMRPITRMGYAFQIIAATNYENDMYTDGRTASEIIRELREFRNSKEPITLVGLLGEEVIGYLTAIGEAVVSRTEIDVEYTVQCSFVEV
jgi:hypothetical protein